MEGYKDFMVLDNDGEPDNQIPTESLSLGKIFARNRAINTYVKQLN